MILYFADRKMNILGLASTELPRGFAITEDLKSEEIETGVTTFSCRIPFGSDDRLTAEQLAAVGNYIFRYDGDTNEFYTIVETEVDTEAGEVYLYAEDAGLDLINEIALQWPTDATAATDRGAHSLAWYYEKLLTTGTYSGGDTGGGDTGFELGINEAAGDDPQELTWSDEATVTERLLDIAGKFDCEIGFRFELDGMTISHKYVDIYKSRGKDLGVQLRLGTDVERIVTKSSIANLATALKVTGGDDAAGTPVNLEGYTYDDGDFFVASGSLLCSREAHDKWSRYIYAEEPETVKNGAGDIVRTFSAETVSQQELCEQAIEELKKLREPEINYEVELSNLPDGVKLGDRVTIVDDDGEHYLSARILKLETSETEDSRTVTLGEYLLRDSGISAQVALLAEQFALLAKNRSLYTWVAYADSAAGTGISLNPNGKAYIGTAINRTEDEPDLTDPTAYSWALIKGASVASVTPYYCLAATQPAKPTTNPPGGAWTTTEPAFTAGSSSNLYTTELHVFSDGSFGYSDVTLSSSYVAAREAIVAANGKNKVFHQTTAPQSSAGLSTGDTWFDTGNDHKMYTWDGNTWSGEQFGTEAIQDQSIKAAKIDVNDLFAQNITATGTITGATLQGSTLIGEEINVSSEKTTTASTSTITIKSNSQFNTFEERSIADGISYDGVEWLHKLSVYDKDSGDFLYDVGSGIKITNPGFLGREGTLSEDYSELKIHNDGRWSEASITFSDGTIHAVCKKTNRETGTTEYQPFYITSGLESNVSYTTFSGNVVSDSTVVVVKKLGWCQVFGALKPTSAGTSWVTILDSSKVPPPQHGFAIYQEATYWSSSYTQPLRIRVGASGGLDICRGYVGGSYGFSITYPIE